MTDTEQTRDVSALADAFRATDAGNALRLVAVADGHVRYVRRWGKFIVYDEGVWKLDVRDVLVVGWAKRVTRAMFEFAVRSELDSELRDPMLRWAKTSESRERLNAMAQLARDVPGVLVEHTELDQRHELLNVLNGTVDLRTGELLKHDPEHLITKQLQVVYDPTATCPTWDRCLAEWQPDPAMRTYLQEKAGAAATGYSPEEFDIHHGDGGNGKSKFWGQVMYVLGEYAVVPHKSLIVAQRHEQHETVVADLCGARLAVAAETKRGDALDEERIKNLSGNDPLGARRMREDRWSFRPTHCMTLLTNHRPRVRSRKEDMWRRLNLVPWEQTWIGERADPTLAATLEAEASGTLNWLVAGARQWLDSGQRFTVPEPVRRATEEYRASADPVRLFLTQVTTQGAALFERTDLLYDTFMVWRTEDDLHEGGELPRFMSRDAFTKDLAGRPQLTRGKKNQVRGFAGLAVRPDWAAYVEQVRECCGHRLQPTLASLEQASRGA